MMLDALAPEFRPEHAAISPADVCERVPGVPIALQAVRGDAKLSRRWRVCVSPRRRRETLPRTHRLEEVDLCNETLARLELLEQGDSITRGLYELMAQDYLAATGELADPPRLTTLSLAPALDYDSASPPRSPRSAYRSMPFSKNGAKVKHLMHKEFGRRRC